MVFVPADSTVVACEPAGFMPAAPCRKRWCGYKQSRGSYHFSLMARLSKYKALPCAVGRYRLPSGGPATDDITGVVDGGRNLLPHVLTTSGGDIMADSTVRFSQFDHIVQSADEILAVMGQPKRSSST